MGTFLASCPGTGHCLITADAINACNSCGPQEDEDLTAESCGVSLGSQTSWPTSCALQLSQWASGT